MDPICPSQMGAIARYVPFRFAWRDCTFLQPVADSYRVVLYFPGEETLPGPPNYYLCSAISPP